MYVNHSEVRLVDVFANWFGLVTPRMAVRKCFERFEKGYDLLIVTLDQTPVDCLVVSKEASIADIHDKRYSGDTRIKFRLAGEVEEDRVFRFRHENTDAPDHVGRSVKYHDFSLAEILVDLMAPDKDLVAPYYYSLVSWARQETGHDVQFMGVAISN